MDRVPRAFRERVAALWKCCTTQNHNGYCVSDGVTDCEWAMVSKEWIRFYIACRDGEWKYGFHISRTDEFLTMDQLLKDPNLKHVEIVGIDFSEVYYREMKPFDVDMERLVKFVAYLSNEPKLELHTAREKNFSSSEGSILLKCLSLMKFSMIFAYNYFPVYDRVFENQFSQRKPIDFHLHNCKDITFFVDHVENGNIRRFYGMYQQFPVEVMESIINAYLENPDSYTIVNFQIVVDFDDRSEALALLERKVEEGLCIKGDGCRYVFNANAAKQTTYECLEVSHSQAWNGALRFEMGWNCPSKKYNAFAASDDWDDSDESDAS